MVFEYDVIYSQRKTICVSISPFNKITVRCPKYTREAVIDGFLEQKSAWVIRTLSMNAKRMAAYGDIIRYEKVLVCGIKMPLVVDETERITCDAVYVRDRNNVKDVYIKTFSDDFLAFAKKLSEESGLTANSFSVKGFKGRWGCCDAKKNIVFNYLLFMLPEHLQRYVIMHELCHTVCMNHSHGFWILLGRKFSDYESCRRQLKTYDFLTDLY